MANPKSYVFEKGLLGEYCVVCGLVYDKTMPKEECSLSEGLKKALFGENLVSVYVKFIACHTDILHSFCFII